MLLAISEEDYNVILRRKLSDEFDVIPNSLIHIKYLLEFIETSKPDIIIVHDKHFGLEADDPHEREMEWLRTVEYIRRKYDDAIRFVFFCERKQGDPFLSELVARHVLDIFHHTNIDIDQLVEQLHDAPRYSKVAYLVVKGSKDRYEEDKVYAPWEEEKKIEEVVVEIESNNDEFQSPLKELGLEETFKQKQLEEEMEREKEKEKKKKSLKFPLSAPSFLKNPLLFKQDKKKQKESTLEEALNDQNTIESIEDTEESKKVKEKKQKEKPAKEKKKRKALITINRPLMAASNVIPKMIAVGSIHPGAGSTFFIHNFSRNLSDLGIPCSVVEAFNEYEALYSLFSAELEPPENWDSLHQIMSKGFKNAAGPRWQFEDVTVFAQKDVENKQLDIEMTKELLFAARQAPIVLVDISHNWDDPISKEALRICDELWCITEPNPHYIRANKAHFKHIIQVTDRIGEDNILIIGNRWEPEADISKIPELFTTFPYYKENVKALNQGVPLYRLKPKVFYKPFDELSQRLCDDF